MSTEWFYKDKIINDEDIPLNSIGFLYRITHIDSGRWYLGKKLLTAASTKTVSGKKKKIRVDSKWRNYWSSSPELLAHVAEVGKDKFKREILLFVETKSQLLYAEEMLLYKTHAILESNCYNSNIRSKVYRKWFAKCPEFLDKIKSI